MKQKLRVFLTLLLCAVASVGWAEEVIFDYPEIYKGTDVLVDVTTDTQNNVTLTYSKGSSSSNPRYYVNGNALRLYKGNTFTVSSDKVITQIVMTSSNSTLGNFSTSTGTYNKGTWTGRANTIVFDISAAARLTKVVVTLEGSTTETVATPTFSPAAGIYTSAQNVTISCTTADATIHYTLDGSTPTAESDTYTSAIPVNSTTTIKAIAYVGEDASSIAEATYTILTPTTIDVARSAENDATVCTGGTVTSISGSTAYIQDATAAIVLYGGNTNTLNVGDKVTVYGKRTEYSGLVEITNAQSTVVSQNNEVSPAVKTISEINTDYSGSNALQAMLVKIEDATVTAINGDNTTIAQGGNTINIYKLSTEVSVNDKITSFVANIGCHNGVQLVNAKDVVVEQTTEPAIVVETTAVELGQGEAEGTIEVTYQNVETDLAELQMCDAEGNAATYDWITAELNDDKNIDYLVEANTGAARTAYMKVYSLDAEGNDVYSELITITQAAYAVDYAVLPFEWAGGASSDFKALVGVTTSGLDSDYSAGNAPYLIKLDNTGDYIMVKTDSRPGKVTVEVKMIGGGNASSIKVQGSSDGQTFSDVETLSISGSQNAELSLETSNDFEESVRFVKLVFTKGSNVGIGAITIAKYTTSASITVAETEVSLTAAESEGTIGVAYKNLADVPEVAFFAADGTTAAEYDWIVAEIDGNNISYMVEANDGEARTAYMKVYGLDAEANDIYSELITITQAAYVAPIAGVKYVKVTSSNDIIDGQYLIVYEDGSVAFNGGLETLDAVGNTIEVTFNNNEIAATDATAAAEFTIDVTAGTLKSASGYYIGQTNDANGMATSADAIANAISIDDNGNANIVSGGAYLRYNSASNQTRFRYFKSTSYTGQKAIQLYKKVGDTPQPETITVTISENAKGKNYANADRYFATLYYSDKNLKMTGANLNAHPVKVKDGKISNIVTYSSNNGNVIPAGMAVMLEAVNPGTYTFEVVDEYTDPEYNYILSQNMLHGTDEAATTTAPGEDGYKFYALSLNKRNTPGTAGFYFRNGCPNGEAFMNGAHKAYLAVPADVAGNAKYFVFGNDTDGIEAIDNSQSATDKIYNISGQRVNKAQKGVYIVNGKKVVIK